MDEKNIHWHLAKKSEFIYQVDISEMKVNAGKMHLYFKDGTARILEIFRIASKEKFLEFIDAIRNAIKSHVVIWIKINSLE